VSDLSALRRDYAAGMLRIAGVADPAIEHAFARIPREDFLGPPPWTVFDPALGAVELAGDDPAPLYEDVLVVLDRERGVNNGSPSLHALMLHHLGVRPGERVLHVGAGAGYYTAVLAELAGPRGRVRAVEYDPRLAEAAAANLGPWPNACVVRGDGADFPTGTVDRIYVNFAVADPAACWFDGLAEGGTLVLPLGVPPGRARGAGRRNSGTGAVLAFTRVAGGIAVRHLTACAFVCAEGPLAGTPALRESLDRAFARGGVEFARSYRRPPPPSPERCWFWSPDWALSYDEPASDDAVPSPRHS
jgi:protein-L-isoaspartate(D-aspartate) O-methyltransferase